MGVVRGAAIIIGLTYLFGMESLAMHMAMTGAVSRYCSIASCT